MEIRKQKPIRTFMAMDATIVKPIRSNRTAIARSRLPLKPIRFKRTATTLARKVNRKSTPTLTPIVKPIRINKIGDMRTKVFLSIVGLTLLVGSCKNPVSDDPHAGHNHGEVKVQLTGYNETFEFFAEADPFSEGNVSAILVHLTRLSNFKPLEAARVTVSLIIGNKGIRQTVERCEQPGIYRFTLKPEAAGKGKVVVDIDEGTTKSRIEVTGVEVFSDEHDAIHAAEHTASHSGLAISFTKEQSWKVDFATDYPSVEPFGQVIKSVAQVQPTQGNEVLITAKTAGIVAIPGEGLLAGKSVASGELLLSVLGTGLGDNSWNVRFAEAQNNFERAKADYDRVKTLATDKIVPERELLAAKTDFENAKALYDNMNDNFNAKGQRVVSPINGYVKQVLVQNGQYVEAGEPLVAVSQNKNLLITADIQQKYLPLLGSVSGANIRTTYNNKVYSLKELNGRVVSYGKSVNNDNFLVPIALQIDNRGDFIPGSFVELYLKTLTNTKAVTLPNTALLEEQGNYFVMVQLTPELFEKREVKIGATDGFNTEIIKGISTSERIVTRGAILVKLAQASAALDPHSGHVH